MLITGWQQLLCCIYDSWYLDLNFGISPFTVYLVFGYVACFDTVRYLDLSFGISLFTAYLIYGFATCFDTVNTLIWIFVSAYLQLIWYLQLLLLRIQTQYLLLNSWISIQQLVQNKITFLNDFLYYFIKSLYYYIARFFILNLFTSLYNLVRTDIYLCYFL